MLMEENKNQPNNENMSNKDDNTIHLNDSQNEDLELLDGIKRSPTQKTSHR